jgi:pilus assembly protein CpaB
MQSRSTTIIGAGVAVAVLGAVMVFVYARNLQGTAGASPSGVTTYVASAAITSGTQGSAVASSVRQVSVPASARPANAITSLTQLNGLAATRNIEAGEVISTTEFGAAGSPSSETGGLAIPAGHNAVAVNAPIPQDVAGYVSPGDLVNIYMTTKDAPPNSARLLLSNVTVLSTVVANSPTAKPGAAAAPAVEASYFTLSLTPADAEKVLFAETYEQVWFGLVHPGDPPATTGGQVLNTLFK